VFDDAKANNVGPERLALHNRPRVGATGHDDQLPATTAHLSWKVLGLLAVMLVVVSGLVLWVLPAALTRHPSHGMTAAERLKATNDARGAIVGFLVAVGAAGTLVYTARTYTLNREGHVTDRYTEAVSQLGDNSAPVRIGGVYALERIGNDSTKDRRTIILCSAPSSGSAQGPRGSVRTILQRTSTPGCEWSAGLCRSLTWCWTCATPTSATLIYVVCQQSASGSRERSWKARSCPRSPRALTRSANASRRGGYPG
jgi:hypothetical protein